MRRLLIGALILLATYPAHGKVDRRAESHVPFVGCRSDGQLGPQRAPKARPTPLVPSSLARRLAFYAASDGPGTLGPRGWHCFGVYGSNGSGLIVAPERLPSSSVAFAGEFKTRGNAIELAYDYGGTSGRWAVAEAIARYFPMDRNFIRENFQGLDVGPLPSGPYPHDNFSKRTHNLVRYTTPPLTKGQGTVWVLTPSAQPIHGLSLLVTNPDGPDLLRVNVRLGDAYRELVPVILDNAGRQAR